MKKHVWLIAVVAAAFWLRMPVCMMACIESAPSKAVHAETAPPCHGAPEPAGEPERADHDCDCDRLLALLAKADVKEPGSGFEHLALVPLPAGATSHAPGTGFASTWRPPGDLPPPDILILNSTWLL